MVSWSSGHVAAYDSRLQSKGAVIALVTRCGAQPKKDPEGETWDSRGEERDFTPGSFSQILLVFSCFSFWPNENLHFLFFWPFTTNYLLISSSSPNRHKLR
ncbi:hypothetical protein GBA52_022201 [Prunus armeniaca]|nr:hypothetical protein GBA52_022201 [Prunus armeniaca]